MSDYFPGSSRTPWLLFVLALVGAGAAGWYAWAEHEQLATDAAAIADANTRAKASDDAKTALQTQVQDLSAKSDQLQANLDATSAELAKLKETSDSLQEQLKAEIAKGEIQVEQHGDRIQVDMVDRVLFDSGDANLSDRGKAVLSKVATVLQTVADKQIQVSGHTDDVPIKSDELKKQFPTNWELSSARAVNVVRYLSETAGVKPERLMAAGYGQYHPIASNATPTSRAKNRRIEILLTPALDAKKVAVAAATPGASPAATPKK